MNSKSKINVLFFMLLMGINSIYSQQENKNFCGTDIPSEDWNVAFQNLVAQKKAEQSANKTTLNNYIIPVVVHVIHGGQAVGNYPNISQAQINSQILVLNNDFEGIGYNSSTYPQSAFANWAAAQNIATASLDSLGRIAMADCGIKFCLATVDPQGNTLAEPGIDRINWQTRAGWVDPGSFTLNNSLRAFIDGTVKPQTIWDVTKYMNIWITDRSANTSLLGYATFPPLTGLGGLQSSTGTSTTDGFWCYSKCFGSATTFPGTSTTYLAGYNRGRVSTHEIGHYLGLRHIWGDGTCANDFCNDTPRGSTSNFGAPAYPFNTTACSGNIPDGEMYMNFMDYTNDPAKYMYTYDQAIRMQTAMANSPFRKFLGTHGVCGPIPIVASFQNTFLACPGVEMTLSNTSLGFPAANYTWTCNGASFNPNNFVTSPKISFPSPGTYVITLTADNGVSNVFSKTITVTSPPIVITASSPTICSGAPVTLNVSGSDTYTWQPGNILNSTVTFSPTQTQVFTCYATINYGCQSTASIAIQVAACTGINKWIAEQPKFNIFPNPSKDILNITFFSDKTNEVTMQVLDALGKTIINEKMEFSKDKQNKIVDISGLANGVYFLKLKALSPGADQDGTAMPQFIKLVKE